MRLEQVVSECQLVHDSRLHKRTVPDEVLEALSTLQATRQVVNVQTYTRTGGPRIHHPDGSTQLVAYTSFRVYYEPSKRARYQTGCWYTTPDKRYRGQHLYLEARYVTINITNAGTFFNEQYALRRYLGNSQLSAPVRTSTITLHPAPQPLDTLHSQQEQDWDRRFHHGY